jgi:hypothetical protein
VDRVREIADAVLYEGYVLWPYRRSAMKNHQRWTFGGVHPPGWSESHPDDAATMQTEVLVEGGPDASVAVSVRFLHVVRREVAQRTADGELELVDALTVGEERHLAWDEAAEREFVGPQMRLDAFVEPHVLKIDIPAERREEPLHHPDGAPAGALVRSWEPLAGSIEITAHGLREGLHRLTVRIENATPWRGATREAAMRRTFCSTHTVVEASGAELVSLTDPPEGLRADAEACRNRGTWPVLAGEEGDRSTILSSPIILSDYPEIAPESPGDLFDGGEIDGMLVLNILALTDEEKAEMRDSDPKTREILERTEALSNEELMSLHGAVRDLRVVR